MAVTPVDKALQELRRVARLQDGARQTDTELLTAIIDHGDEVAFEAVVRRHGPMVLGVCRRVVRNHHDAEDAFQATFLVLARKAARVRPRQMLGNWLYGVAYRTAMKARALSAKRRAREKPLNEVSEPAAPPHDPWFDLRALLDRELSRLPDNYRVAILLCDVTGATIVEAARQLGWPQGTTAGRLARGRKLLAKRLANRGVGPSAGLLAAVPRDIAVPEVPASLARSTAGAASRMGAGRAAVADWIPVRVTVLTKGVLRGMLLTKLKSVGALLLAAGAVAFAASPMLAHRLQAAQDAPAKPATGPKPDVEAANRPANPPPKKDSVNLPPFTFFAPVQALVSLKGGKLVVRTVTGNYEPMESKRANGQNVTSYVLRQGVTTAEYELKVVKLRDMKGKPMDVKQLPKLLGKETVALIASDDIALDPLHLRLFKDGTLLFLLPLRNPGPAISTPPVIAPGAPMPVPAVPVPAVPAPADPA